MAVRLHLYRARAEIVKTLASGFTSMQTEDSLRRLRKTIHRGFSSARLGIVVFTIPNRAEYIRQSPHPTSIPEMGAWQELHFSGQFNKKICAPDGMRYSRPLKEIRPTVARFPLRIQPLSFQ
jgi:hypothetical protein